VDGGQAAAHKPRHGQRLSRCTAPAVAWLVLESVLKYHGCFFHIAAMIYKLYLSFIGRMPVG